MRMRLIATVAIFAIATASPTSARDDGRYLHSQLKAWFDQLASGNGNCCSFADGVTIDDPDVDMSGKNCAEAVCVRIGGKWLGVPDEAIVKRPNIYGPAVVWPYQDVGGATRIRCFLPGAGA